MKISYNWLKWYVPEILEADKTADVFTYHLCEVESLTPVMPESDPASMKDSNGSRIKSGMTQPEDWIFDLNILPNRAHDLLSHQGIARELSGQLGIAFKDPTELYKIPEAQPTTLAIDIQTPLCRRYMGRIVRNVKVGPSPEWVVKHLESIGQRSINNVVDATNIVLFDCGQPAHVFDLRKLKVESEKSGALHKCSLKVEIQIRTATAGEKIQLLGGEEKELKETDMVIADVDGALALAGVKGGTRAEVDENTVDIVLEVANFDPATVRKTARRFGMLTDASKRFENDLSPEFASYAMRELSATILEMCPEATFEEIVDIYPAPQQSREIIFSVSDINRKLGTNISADEIETVFTNYNFTFEREENAFKLVPPALRLDLVGVHDVVEEIGRIVGYEEVVPTMPSINFAAKKNTVYEAMCAAREKLLADGYSEVITYSFGKKGKVEVARAAKGKEFLRTNLADGLKESYELNRLNAPLIIQQNDSWSNGKSEIKIFEIGTVFPSTQEEVHVVYADKKGVVESTLEEFSGGLPPENSSSELKVESAKSKVFAPWSNYPFISRDIAVWVPVDTDPNELVSLCKEKGTALLIREPQLFDQFTKGDKTSLAVRLVFQSMERTLTDAEVTEIITTISSAITAKGWEIR